MARQVTRYEANDGTIHESMKLALQHDHVVETRKIFVDLLTGHASVVRVNTFIDQLLITSLGKQLAQALIKYLAFKAVSSPGDTAIVSNTVSTIVNTLFHDITNSSWAEKYPEAYAGLNEYRADIAQTIQKVLDPANGWLP